MPILNFLEVPVSESDQKAQVKLMLPPDFDSGKKYPLVVYAYGGPGYQAVNKKFDWNEIGTFLAGSANVIYAIVDPRGSGYQGEDWRFAVYKKFGSAEVQSLTQVTKHLQVGNLKKKKKENRIPTVWKCHNFTIFVFQMFRFYATSILGILEVQNLLF